MVSYRFIVDHKTPLNGHDYYVLAAGIPYMKLNDMKRVELLDSQECVSPKAIDMVVRMAEIERGDQIEGVFMKDSTHAYPYRAPDDSIVQIVTELLNEHPVFKAAVQV